MTVKMILEQIEVIKRFYDIQKCTDIVTTYNLIEWLPVLNKMLLEEKISKLEYKTTVHIISTLLVEIDNDRKQK